MARSWYGGDLAFWTYSSLAAPTLGASVKVPQIVGSTVWFYNASSGGTRYTDLLDAASAAITQVLTDSTTGLGPRFQGPDGVTQMWADANAGSGPRRVINADPSFVLPATTAGLLATTDMVTTKYIPGSLYGVAEGVATLSADGLSVDQLPPAHTHTAYVTIVRPDNAASAQRPTVKFTGGATVTDDSGNARTVVDITQSIVNDLKVTADVTLNNQGAKQNITGMSQAVVAGEEWIFDGVFFLDGDTAADASLDLTCPAGTLLASWTGLAIAATGPTGATNLLVTTTSGVGGNFAVFTVSNVRVWATFICTTTGTVQFRWAQNIATVANTTLKAGSRITAARVV